MEIRFNKGITQQQVEELIKYSNNDELVRVNTQDARRFADQAAFEQWIITPKEIYTLTDNSQALLGLIWLKPQQLPEKNYTTLFDKEKFGITFAIRLYEKARGKGYSKPFLDWAFDEYKKNEQYNQTEQKGIWLETRSNNLAAISLYEKFGFMTVSSPDENDRIIMVQAS